MHVGLLKCVINVRNNKNIEVKHVVMFFKFVYTVEQLFRQYRGNNIGCNSYR